MQRNFARQSHSQILDLDFKNWLIDGAISTGVAIAFILMLILQDTPWSRFIPYADPGLVMLLVIFVIPLPLKTIAQNSWQMMGRAPGGEQRKQVECIVARTLGAVPHQDYTVRQVNMGRLMYVQVYVCVSLAQEESYEPGEVDELRSQLYAQLNERFPHLAMDMVVTCDRIWMRRAVTPMP